MQSNNQPTKPYERLYPKLSPADKDRFLHDFARAVADGAVKKPHYKVVAIEDSRNRGATQ
jgi:hypothetical protein